ncbi:hypothetical protein RHE_PE00127 (plasmid) [Rhizobium etli CFN 42]|uniref:Uncharacterized protein n=1 Tax=Rhizobium etli (strain ATCC 51251 / DSM 11541 / JCM 21823 / NBRC 15573 / CFN 42) TaxID=347834 RepID=Q2K0C1_RHIEC|nr:hypothetical protein RHE_PE00127 [Rhizobium etli CFN 42]
MKSAGERSEYLQLLQREAEIAQHFAENFLDPAGRPDHHGAIGRALALHEAGRLEIDQRLAAGLARHDGDQETGEIGLIDGARFLSPILDQPRLGVGGEHRGQRPLLRKPEALQLGRIAGERHHVIIVQVGEALDIVSRVDAEDLHRIEKLGHQIGRLGAQLGQMFLILAGRGGADAIREADPCRAHLLQQTDIERQFVTVIQHRLPCQ